MPLELYDIVQECLKRLRRWPVPPRWTRADWHEEITAHAEAAACAALKDYDASRSACLIAFVQSRVIASVLTRYRQEWAYSLHCAAEVANEETQQSPYATQAHESLGNALAQLSPPDRQLIEQLFWQGRTEAEIGQMLSISHQAISKRKRAILRKLRGLIENSEE